MTMKQLVLNGDNANNPEAVGSNPTPATNLLLNSSDTVG
jgi:hypothetical protein